MTMADKSPTNAAASSAAASLVEREAATTPKSEASIYGKCQPDKVPLLLSLIQAYDERRTRLKPHHKRLLKQIHSLRQGFDGTKVACYKCGKVHDIEDTEIHHINNNPSDNRLINTAPISSVCNRELNGRKGGEINKQRAAAHHSSFSDVTPVYVRENGAGALAHTGASDEDLGSVQWTSREGKTHDKIRRGWNSLLWTLFNPEDEDMNWIGKGRLANFAPSPDFVGVGTCTTFYKVIGEDIAQGILKDDVNPDDYSEIVRMIWPSDADKARLRELALAYSQDKISHADLSDSIKAITAPSKETRRHWNYVRWYLAKKIGKAKPAETGATT